MPKNLNITQTNYKQIVTNASNEFGQSPLGAGELRTGAKWRLYAQQIKIPKQINNSISFALERNPEDNRKYFLKCRWNRITVHTREKKCLLTGTLMHSFAFKLTAVVKSVIDCCLYVTITYRLLSDLMQHLKRSLPF